MKRSLDTQHNVLFLGLFPGRLLTITFSVFRNQGFPWDFSDGAGALERPAALEGAASDEYDDGDDDEEEVEEKQKQVVEEAPFEVSKGGSELPTGWELGGTYPGANSPNPTEEGTHQI